MRKIGFYFCLIYLLAASCSEKQTVPNVSIEGNMEGLSKEWIYLDELEPRQVVAIDSVIATEDGSFEFRLFVEDAGFYIIRTARENSMLLLIGEGEEIFLEGDGRFDSALHVTGSEGTGEILEFENFMDHQRRRIDSLAAIYDSGRGSENFFALRDSLDSLYQMIVERQRSYVTDFIKRHPGSLSNLIVINRRLGQSEVFDPKNDFLVLYKVDSLLQQTHPNNKHTLDHHERVGELRGMIFDDYVIEEKLSPGKRAPDVVVNDTSDRPVSLKSYTGKRVLLYFWAGWDAKSRQVNRRLVELYPKLKQNNTEILGISLDENRTVWMGAIRLDNLEWEQVSELKGFYSEIKKSYHVPDKLPYFYLINEEQKIAAKHADLDSILVLIN